MLGPAAQLIHVFDPHQPLSAVNFRIEITAERRNQRTEVERPRGRRGETSAINSTNHRFNDHGIILIQFHFNL
jgi:hypothetical protein